MCASSLPDLITTHEFNLLENEKYISTALYAGRILYFNKKAFKEILYFSIKCTEKSFVFLQVLYMYQLCTEMET